MLNRMLLQGRNGSQCIHDIISRSYLQSSCRHDIYIFWRRLRYSASHRLKVPPLRLYSRQVGVSGFWIHRWNDLRLHIASAPSLAVFRQWLKTVLISRSYQDTISKWLVCYCYHSPLGYVWTPTVLAII